MDAGGLAIFCVIPSWLVGFIGRKTKTTYHPPYAHRGRPHRGFLRIKGNMPGRCDAGRIWQATFDEFLLGYGLRQLITDCRVRVIRTALGDLIIHDHVGDSRVTSTTPEARSSIYAAWGSARLLSGHEDKAAMTQPAVRVAVGGVREDLEDVEAGGAG